MGNLEIGDYTIKRRLMNTSSKYNLSITIFENGINRAGWIDKSETPVKEIMEKASKRIQQYESQFEDPIEKFLGL